MTRNSFHRRLTAFGYSILSVFIFTFQSGQTRAAPQDDRYLQAVQAYADTMLEKGRDRWGEVQTPLFAVTLNRSNYELFGADKGEVHQVLGIPVLYGAKMWGASANPPVNVGLYRVLYGLTDVTGEAKYAQAADEAMRYFWTHCQDPYSGLMYWGEEMAWHLTKDMSCTYIDGWRLHEPFPYPFFEHCYSLGQPVQTALFRYANGLWAYTFIDHEKALWNRHYHIDEWPKGARGGTEYPRLVGQFCYNWALAYAHSTVPLDAKDSPGEAHFQTAMLEAITSVVENSLRRCADNGALPAKSGSDQLWTVQNMFMMRKLHQTAERVPEPLAEKTRELIARQRAVMLDKLAHPMTPEQGYVSFANVHTLEPGRPGAKKPTDYSTLWTMGWAGTAGIALELLGYDEAVDGDPEIRALALQGARLYLKEESPAYPENMRVDNLAYTLELMVRAYEVSGDKVFLDKARALAADAMELFFGGTSPLPRASSGKGGLRKLPGDCYAAGTYDDVRGGGGDDLMHALLKLHKALP